jgi:hypothetical protein
MLFFEAASDLDEAKPKTPTLKMKSYYTEAESRNPDFRCNPGQSVTVECNTCGCGDDGKLNWCTLVGCVGDSWKVVRPE